MTRTLNPKEDLQRHYLEELRQLSARLDNAPRVSRVLDGPWFGRCEEQIEALDPNALPDGPLQVLREFRDGGSDLVCLLESSLDVLIPIAERQRRARDIRETVKKLSGGQINQATAAIFEIVVLGGLCAHGPKTNATIELFPRVGPGGGNVETRVDVGGRWMYLEAKALGYSQNDNFGDPGVFLPHRSSEARQIRDALNEKVGKARQLALVPDGQPTVVCLALGHNATPDTAPQAIQEFFSASEAQLSAVLLFQGPCCRVRPLLELNSNSQVELNPEEEEWLKGVSFNPVALNWDR